VPASSSSWRIGTQSGWPVSARGNGYDTIGSDDGGAGRMDVGGVLVVGATLEDAALVVVGACVVGLCVVGVVLVDGAADV
jgi:hypothetical protein